MNREPEPAARRRAAILSWGSLGLLVATLFVAGSARVAAVAQEEEGDQSGEPTSLTWEDCFVCHDEAEAYKTTAHGRAMLRVDEALFDGACVACHGDATEHIEDPLPENIVRFPEPSACAKCHIDAGQQMALALPAHDRRSVVCLDCHEMKHGLADDPEHGKEAEWLLDKSAFHTCGECHASVASSFNWPFAHRQGKKPFECTECHSVHNQDRVARLTQQGDGGPCTECHIDQVGPFVFPHPPRVVNGCTECHMPHGSTNPRQLDRHSVMNLCLECHADVPSFHDVSRPRYRNCTTCHVAIHGSNRSATFFDP